MKILAIESSCDETSAAIVEGAKTDPAVKIIANNTASSLPTHSKTGGIIPEAAAREQVKFIIPVIKKTLEDANLSFSSQNPPDLDAIAVTIGPGLIGSLLVGVETAKTLSFIWNKPIIPVNHLIGHIYANFVEQTTDYRLQTTVDSRPSTVLASIEFPAIVLVVSGGHTDLILLKNNGKITWLGGTRDDAAGECFDKCARMLGYAYPGGPVISELAQKGNSKNFTLPHPMSGSKDLDFSFSGLKTAFAKLLTENFNIQKGGFNKKTNTWEQTPLINLLENKEQQKLYDLCASLEDTIVDSLIDKAILAIQTKHVEQLIVAGGVAANKKLKMKLKTKLGELGVKLYIPEPKLCTDNGAMIASAAFFTKPNNMPLNLQANPNLSLSS